ncbi:MAG: M48 family metallopeptidase [Halobacteriaceae archaeon]
MVLGAFVALLVGTEAVFTGLAALNLRHGERTLDERRRFVTEELGVEDVRELRRYVRVGTALGQVRTWAGLGAVLLVVPTGLLGAAVESLAGLGLGTVAEGTVFFVGVAVALRLAAVPFDLADTFGVEQAFGFNNQSPRLWVRDTVVGLALTVVFVAPLAAAVVWLLVSFPGLWWVGAWAVFLAFSLAMFVLYPRVIAPLFNDFEPIETGDLRDAVEEVLDRAGFSCEQIYEMDASRRTSHSNAYFIGFGRTKRVVLFDTLVERLSLPALQAVLAHELAHWQENHVWKQLGATALRTGVLLGVLSVLVDAPWLATAFGLPAGATYAHLAVAALFVEPLARLSAPLENRPSLAHEREADAFAVEVMGAGEPMADALAALLSENLSNPFPHPWYAAFHHSHPPVPERIRRVRELGGGRSDGAVEGGAGAHGSATEEAADGA